MFGRVSGDAASAYLLRQASSADKAVGRLGAVAGHLLETRVRIDPGQSRVNLEFSWAGNGSTSATAAPSTSTPSPAPQLERAKEPKADAPATAAASEEKKVTGSTESSSSSSSGGSKAKEFTAEEVAKHNKKDDVWVIVNGQVLDVTNVCFSFVLA